MRWSHWPDAVLVGPVRPEIGEYVQKMGYRRVCDPLTDGCRFYALATIAWQMQVVNMRVQHPDRPFLGTYKSLITLFLVSQDQESGKDIMADDSKACENCRHFDLDEGQAQIFGEPNHGAFVQASRVLPPSAMSRRVQMDASGEAIYDKDGMPVFEPSSVPAKTQWTEFGACDVHNEGRHKTDWCDQHQVPLKLVPPTPAAPAADEKLRDLIIRRAKRWLREKLED